jgi:elongation factor P
MATTADFRNGLCIVFKDDLYTIVQFQHVKPGKGPAFVRTKLKNVKTGRVIDKTFNAGVKVDEVRIERRPHQFLYFEGDDCVFMNTEDFEQINLSKDLINGSDFMKEGDTVELIVHAESDTVLYGDMPTHVIMEVTYTEPGLKGDTATNTLKPATVENGANVRVPLFINEGDKIKIDTRDGSYVERIRE